ncbi:MAG: hypothetical protein GXP37_11805 [Chloroflexi bacterium]|nr:hypothetical protein [Chloroflexota bacterium]
MNRTHDQAGFTRRCFGALRFIAGRSAGALGPGQTDAANTRKKEALGASVMRRSATSNLTPKFRGHTLRLITF